MSELIRYITTNGYSCYTITFTKPISFDVTIDLDNQLLKVTFEEANDLEIVVGVSYKKIRDAELINRVSEIVMELNSFFEDRQVFTEKDITTLIRKIL